MIRYLYYIKSVLSYKKLFYNDISFTAYWDRSSTFTKYTKLGPYVRLLDSKIGKFTRISKGCSLLYCDVGKFTSFADNVQLGAGRHPLEMVSTSQLFYNRNSLQNKWVKNIEYKQNEIPKIGTSHKCDFERGSFNIETVYSQKKEKTLGTFVYRTTHLSSPNFRV